MINIIMISKSERVKRGLCVSGRPAEENSRPVHPAAEGGYYGPNPPSEAYPLDIIALVLAVYGRRECSERSNHEVVNRPVLGNGTRPFLSLSGRMLWEM